MHLLRRRGSLQLRSTPQERKLHGFVNNILYLPSVSNKISISFKFKTPSFYIPYYLKQVQSSSQRQDRLFNSRFKYNTRRDSSSGCDVRPISAQQTFKNSNAKRWLVGITRRFVCELWTPTTRSTRCELRLRRHYRFIHISLCYLFCSAGIVFILVIFIGH